MKNFLLLAALLCAGASSADTQLKNEGTAAGSVTTLNCVGNAINCTRAATTSTGTLTVRVDATAPLIVYSDGGSVNVSMTEASAIAAGYLPIVAGRLVVDAGFTSTLDIAATNFTASASSAQFGCSSTSGTCQIRSSISAANATSSNAAFQFRPQNTLDADDSVIFVSGATSGHPGVFQVDYEGDTIHAGTCQATGFYPTTGAVESTSTTLPLSLTSDMNATTATASVPAARVCAGAVLDALDLVFAVGAPGGCSTEVFSVDNTGSLLSASSKTKGQITIGGGGTGTATVLSGAICTCSNTAALNAVRCNVASTTLTATGTAADVINYTCL